jgi:hypothetical protein
MAISLVTPSHRALIPRIEKLTKSRIKEGKIPSRREIGAKKVAKVFADFQSQAFHERAMEHLHEDWQAALAAMSKEEIAGRFIAMLSPETFDNTQEKQKPLQGYVPVDSQGNALPNGGRSEGKRGGYRDRRARDDERRHGRGGGGYRGGRGGGYGAGRGAEFSAKPEGRQRSEGRGTSGEAGGEHRKESPAQRKHRFKTKPRRHKSW